MIGGVERGFKSYMIKRTRAKIVWPDGTESQPYDTITFGHSTFFFWVDMRFLFPSMGASEELMDQAIELEGYFYISLNRLQSFLETQQIYIKGVLVS